MSVDYKALTAAFVYEVVSADAWFASAIPDDATDGIRIYPHIAPASVAFPFVTQELADDVRLAGPIGAPPTQFELQWQIMIWTDQNFIDDIAPLSERLLDVLVGADMKGLPFDYERESDNKTFRITTRYVGPVVVAGAVELSATYANTAHRLAITVQRVS